MIHVLNNVPKIVHGFGAISRAGAEIVRIGGKRLIDNNPRKANAQQILALLEEHYERSSWDQTGRRYPGATEHARFF